MKTKLQEYEDCVNNHLFDQIKILNSINIKGERLDEEVKRAEAMLDLANQINETSLMQNKLQDYVNNHLFDQIKILNSIHIKGERLNEEVKRAEAMLGLAQQIN